MQITLLDSIIIHFVVFWQLNYYFLKSFSEKHIVMGVHLRVRSVVRAVRMSEDMPGPVVNLGL